MITDKPEVGQTFLYLEKVNPALISASSMAPTEILLKVVAMDEQDVWYKREDRSQTTQTSIERFMSAVHRLIGDEEQTLAYLKGRGNEQ